MNIGMLTTALTGTSASVVCGTSCCAVGSKLDMSCVEVRRSTGSSVFGHVHTTETLAQKCTCSAGVNALCIPLMHA